MKEFDLLGCKATEKTTGYNGCITSVSLDIAGCVQAFITPQADKAKENDHGRWYDVVRLKIGSRVMPTPWPLAREKGSSFKSAP